MNTVPLLFADSVMRLIDDLSIRFLVNSNVGLFTDVGRAIYDNEFELSLNVVCNSAAGTFDYCLTHRQLHSFSWYAGPHTHGPAKHRFVFQFRIYVIEKGHIMRVKSEPTWTTASSSDPEFLRWLKVPFARTELFLRAPCSKFLMLLPEYYTFNIVRASSVYSKVLDAIIERSQECGRLECLFCKKFADKYGSGKWAWKERSKRLHVIF